MQNNLLQLELLQQMYALKGIKYDYEYTPEFIVNTVCNALNINKTDLLSKRKTRRIADARCIASHLLRTHTDLKLAKVGLMVGVTHHATILFQVKKCEALAKCNTAFAAKKNKVENLIKTLCV